MPNLKIYESQHVPNSGNSSSSCLKINANIKNKHNLVSPWDSLASEITETEIYLAIRQNKSVFSTGNGRKFSAMPPFNYDLLCKMHSVYCAILKPWAFLVPLLTSEQHTIIQVMLVLKWHGDTFVFTSGFDYKIDTFRLHESVVDFFPFAYLRVELSWKDISSKLTLFFLSSKTQSLFHWRYQL